MCHYLGILMERDHLVGLPTLHDIFFPTYHFSESFIPFFTVCHDNSGISPLLRMSHHFFHAPRSLPGSKFTLCPWGLCQVYLYRAIKVSRLFPIQCNVQIPSESTPMLFPCSFQFTLARSYSSFGFFLTNYTFL